MNIKILSTICLSLLFSGCAAMSVDECKTANWTAVGEKDGSNGRERRLNQYYKACSEANIIPNQSQYDQGYRKGLDYYCQPDMIFHEALKGKGLYQVCPVETRTKLRPFYDSASRYYMAENEYNSYQTNLKDYTDKAYNTKLKPEERERYRNLLKQLQQDASRITTNYHDAIRDLEKFKYQNGLN